MSGQRQSLGAFGEGYAAAQLARAGYRVLERNVRLKSGEIDMVARDRGTLVFVEVRTKRSAAFGTPEESVTTAKAQRLIRLGHEYLRARGSPSIPWRIDVVAVMVDGRGTVTRFNHIENAIG